MKFQLFIIIMLGFLVHAQTWYVETVDSTSSLGMYNSLALDSSGKPRISYCGTNNNLKYAFRTGTSWEIETVDSVGHVGWYNSLALDSSDNPHISYVDDTNNNLKYAFWNGSSWEIETVDSTGSVGRYNSLALDSSGNSHISYFDDTNQDLKYAFRNGSSWEIETVDSTGSVGTYTSLAIDSSDNPHISYIDTANDDLKYALWNGSSWEIEAIDGAYDVTSLKLDSSGNPQFSFHSCMYPVWNFVKYAFWNGSSWETETVYTTQHLIHPSLELDSSDNPHILVSDTINLFWFQRYGTSWEYEWLYPLLGRASRYFSFLLDSSNNPHISFSNADNANLMYVCRIETGIEESAGVDNCYLLPVSPNPSKGAFAMDFNVTENSEIGLYIFDLSGRLVMQSPVTTYSSGLHQIHFSDLETGVYLCRMRSGDFTETQQFVVID